MNKKYWLETYGCQMNFAESTALEEELAQNGWMRAEVDQEADLILINTCAVRESAEKRIWGRLGYFKSIKRNQMTIAVMGCMAQRLGDSLKRREPSVDLVVSNFSKQIFSDLLSRVQPKAFPLTEKLAVEDQFHFAENHARRGDFSAFVPIMHGCNNFCTFCIVPYVRGREISRSPQSIIDEINRLEAQGVVEVTLLGQNVNSYHFNEDGVDLDFLRLLEVLLNRTTIPWIRFTSSHPKDLSPHLADLIAKHTRLCNHFHLPMQHGSDRILKLMNRRYDYSHYKGLVDMLRDKVPDIAISTDLLIGFPGETEADFFQTLERVEEIGFDDAFTYYYNVRSGTKAAEMNDQLPEAIKKERLARLIELRREISVKRKLKELGRETTVLVEKVSRKNSGEWLARSEKNQMFVFGSDRVAVGDFCRLKVKSLEGSTFKGEVVQK